MAIDPRIPLAVQVAQVPARIPDPFERAVKIISLRDMMQRRELQAQQAEAMAGYRRSLIEQKEREAEQARLKQESVDKWKTLWETGRTPTPQETFGILGPDGIKVVTELEDLETKRIANENTRLGWVSNAANAVLENPTGFNLRYHADNLFNRKALTKEQYEDLISLDVENPATISKLEAMRAWSRDVKQQSDEALARTTQKDTILKSAAEAATAQAEAELKGLSVKDATRAFNAIKLAGALEHSPEAFNAEYGKLLPAERSWFSGATTPDEIRMRGLPLSTRTAETRLRAGGMMEPPPEDVQAWQLKLRSTGPPRQPLAVGAADQQLADTVIANPALYENLTPSAKTRIAPLLAGKGFTGFGKPLAESAMKQISESRSAIESLRDLRQTLNENEQYIGPISGVQALNPYSDARKAQAKIDLVKQRVGKALEGGVLRKEDEEKYKKILATLYDTPSTAISKVDNLIATLERDIKLFEDEQRRGGRNVPPRTEGPPGGAGEIVERNGRKFRFLGGDRGKKENWQEIK